MPDRQWPVDVRICSRVIACVFAPVFFLCCAGGHTPRTLFSFRFMAATIHPMPTRTPPLPAPRSGIDMVITTQELINKC